MRRTGQRRFALIASGDGCFDADVLIYAGVADHPLGQLVRALSRRRRDALAGVGSVLLLPEVLAKPMRDGSAEEVAALAGLLG
jgi:hypothetical protein